MGRHKNPENIKPAVVIDEDTQNEIKSIIDVAVEFQTAVLAGDKRQARTLENQMSEMVDKLPQKPEVRNALAVALNEAMKKGTLHDPNNHLQRAKHALTREEMEADGSAMKQGNSSTCHDGYEEPEDAALGHKSTNRYELNF